MKKYLPFLIVAGAALLTVVAAAMLYRAKRVSAVTVPKEMASSRDATIHVRGRANAPVILEEFGDFECPPCAKLSEPLNQLEKDYRNRLALVFRHFPLPNHPHARAAAFAAEAAALQGRFWEMHDVLYREQENWSKAPDVQVLFNAYAGMLGLDVARLNKDMRGEQVEERVAADQKRAVSLAVKTTPSIFINNRALPATELKPGGVRAAVEAEIKKEPASHEERE